MGLCANAGRTGAAITPLAHGGRGRLVGTTRGQRERCPGRPGSPCFWVGLHADVCQIEVSVPTLGDGERAVG